MGNTNKQPTTHEHVKGRLLGSPGVREVYEKPPLRLKVARAVVEGRKTLGMTQEELAKRMGTSQAQVWRIESGRFNPTVQTLSRLEEALGAKLVGRKGGLEGWDAKRSTRYPDSVTEP